MISTSPLMTIEIEDKDIGLEGYICIHSMGKYGASGGMRCIEDVSKKEVQLLAWAMTHKYSYFNIEQGGAKAGLKIPYDCDQKKRELLIKAVARHIEPLIKKGVWSCWTDMNFYYNDLKLIFDTLGLQLSAKSEDGSSFRTAVSAYSALEAVKEYFSIAKPKLVIEGFGSVSKYLLKILHDLNYEIVGLSNHHAAVCNSQGLDINRVIQLREQFGNKWIYQKGEWDNIDRSQLFGLKCDIFIPCARVHSITQEVARQIDAKIMVPIANVPFTPDGFDCLKEKGVICLPDYVVNGGGVCGSLMPGGSIDNLKATDRYVEVLKNNITRMIQKSVNNGVSPLEIADIEANKNYINITKSTYDRDSLSYRVRKKIFGRQTQENHNRDLMNRTLMHLESMYIA